MPTCRAEVAEIIDRFVQLASRRRESDVGEFGSQVFQVPTCGGVNYDGAILSGALDLANTVAKAFQAAPRLRGTEVDEEVVAFGIGHLCFRSWML